MGVSEAFLVNTKNFDTIISALASCGIQPVNTQLIKNLGYSDPNDLLVVRLLKDFKVIYNDGSPAEYYDDFQNPETTKQAIAEGLLEAYSGLFEKNPSIHHAPPDKVKEAFAELLGDKKTDLIIKYITSTFLCVTAYCGTATIDAVQTGEAKLLSEALAATKNGNGVHHNKQKTAEEMGDKTINDFVGNFNFAQKSRDDQKKSEKEELQKNGTKNKKESNKEDLKTGAANHNNWQENMENADPKTDNDPFSLNVPLAIGKQSAESTRNPTKDEFIQKALLRKSDLLYKLQRWEKLLPTLEEIINRYGNPAHANLREGVSRAVIHRATVLLKLNRLNEALPALDSVIEHFKDSGNKEFYQKASMAMIYKAQLLEKDETANLLPLYNAIIERTGSCTPEVMQRHIDQIHLKRFDLICDAGEPRQILDASSELIKRFKDDQKYTEYLQTAMIQRAQILDEMNRDEDALEAYDEFLAAFG